MGSHFLLQGIFPTQGSNLGLLCCRQTLHHLREMRYLILDHSGSNRGCFKWYAKITEEHVNGSF